MSSGCEHQLLPYPLPTGQVPVLDVVGKALLVYLPCSVTIEFISIFVNLICSFFKSQQDSLHLCESFRKIGL